MRVTHLNCGTCCPAGGRLMDGRSRGLTGRLVCHCLLLETDDGLVLVDTGYGMRECEHPFPRLPRPLTALTRPVLDVEETAYRRLQKLGFDPADVRHIVITHLDFDHAGGIPDFPLARVHVLMDEFQAAAHATTPLAKERFRPVQWTPISRFRFYPRGEGESWFGFQAVRGLDGLPPDILLVPLIGHTWGHCGVAVQAESGWMLNAGDAYFHASEMRPDGYHCPPGLRAYQRLMEVDRKARVWNQERLRELVQTRPDIDVFSAHDASEFELHAQRNPHRVPTARPEAPVPSPS